MWAQSRLVQSPFAFADPLGPFGPLNDYTMDSNLLNYVLMEMLALGGVGVNAGVGILTPGSDGTYSVTGDLGGETPDLVILATNGLFPPDSSGTTTGVAMSWGAASATDQWACFANHPYNSSTGVSSFRTGAILCADTGSDVTLDSMDVDGFTVTLTNWISGLGLSNIGWIMVKLPAGVKVGVTQQPVGTGVVSESGFGFDPSALIVSGTDRTADSGTATLGPGFVGGFAAVEGDGQFCQSANHWPGDRYQTASWFDDAHVIKSRSSDGSFVYADVAEAAADFVTDGVDFIWTICDGTQRLYGYIAIETDELYDGTTHPIVNLHFGGRWSADPAVAGQGVDGTFTSSPGDANIGPSVGFARGPSPDSFAVGWYGGGQDSLTTALAEYATGIFAGSSIPAAVWSLTYYQPAIMSRFVPQVMRYY